MPDAEAAASQLETVRDFLRWALSSFAEAKIAHGHGTTSALDEAAFIILETLHLPVDDINPWLDARLLEPERRRLAELIRDRVILRKPAAYLTKRIYIGGIPFYVDERVIVPRSYIGELMMSGLFAGEASLSGDPERVGAVLDLCTGSGCLAILAANAFPNADIDAVELSADALEVARTNVDDHSDVQLARVHEPGYAAEVEAFAPEYAHEPVMAHLGGEDGLDLVRRILAESAAHLNPGGGLLCEIGTGRGILEDEYPQLDFLWLDTEESEGEVFWITREALAG
ncbi:MAG: methyltransferase [Alphaproteobacteria bacterium]|nr:methyltransferase [Alphaproteobacteria bacterium]